MNDFCDFIKIKKEFFFGEINQTTIEFQGTWVQL
jgi:hypothetical protein